MSSLRSNILLVAALLVALVAGTRTASASVTSVGGASFEVSAQVVASCSVETGAASISAATTSVSCEGTRAGLVDDSSMANLGNLTSDEAAAPADARAVTVVY